MDALFDSATQHAVNRIIKLAGDGPSDAAWCAKVDEIIADTAKYYKRDCGALGDAVASRVFRVMHQVR